MKGYDYAYGKYKPRIELDEDEEHGTPMFHPPDDPGTLFEKDGDVAFLRCTCLDRARIALEQSGQHTCAWMMKNLQQRFDELAQEYEMDPCDPLGILRELL